MADCCAELKQELAQLRTEIAKLKPIDEKRIIEEAVSTANARYGLAMVPVALPALSRLLPYIDKIIQAVLGLIALIAGVAALRGDVGGIKSEISRIWGRINGSIEPAIKDLEKTAEVHTRRLDALQGNLRSTRDIAVAARRRADAAYEFVEEIWRRAQREIKKVENKADKAILQANTAQYQAMLARGAANEARISANKAVADANKATDRANRAYSAAITAQRNAQSVRQDALTAKEQAGEAQRRAQEARLSALLANRSADRAIGEANNATRKANDAARDAQKAIDQVNTINKNVDNTKRNLDQLSNDSKNGNIFRQWSPTVWQPVVTAAETRVTPKLENIKVGLGNFDRALTKANQDIKNFQGDIATFDSSLKRNQADIRKFQGDIATFDSSLKREVATQVNQTVGVLPENIKSLPGTVTNIQSKLGQLENFTVDNSTRIKTLEGSDTTTRNRVGTLEGSNATTNSRLRTLETDNVQFRDRVAEQERVNEQGNDLLRDVQRKLGGLETAIPLAVGASIPLILAQNNTFRQAIGEVSEAATCRTTRPGGCLGSRFDSLQNGQNNLLDKFNAFANTAQAAALGVLQNTVNGIAATTTAMNAKLGAEMAGGLSGGISRLGSFLGIDRILNLLNFLATAHNAIMLTNGLKQTLLATLSSVGNATGLLQGPEGDSVDLNQVANQGIEQLMIKLFGAEVWAEIETNWRKYNRIYQAGANAMNAVSSMMNALGDGIEQVAEHTGKIGNALKTAGQVREDAFQWFSEKINIRNSRFLTYQSKVGAATGFLNAVNEVAESVIEGQEAYTEAVKATQEFHKQVVEADKNKGEDNKAVKAEIEKNKALSTKDPTGEEETGLLSFLTNL